MTMASLFTDMTGNIPFLRKNKQIRKVLGLLGTLLTYFGLLISRKLR